MDKKDKFIIEGLEGEKKLKGSVKIQGAKNAALKAMAAAALFDGAVELTNVPETEDIKTMSEILSKLGARVEKSETLTIDASKINNTDIDAELAGSMRASVVLTGPLLARFGRVSFPAPGGCVIGARPIDLFLDGYRSMRATVAENGLYDIQAEKGLKGAEMFFDKQTVGGTETLMMAAVLAKGRTVLKNCAMEPEIASIAEWLNSCGANIKGAGTTTIEIEGTAGKLLKSIKPYVTIPDRIESGSFLILGALCAEELKIEGCEPKHMEAAINVLHNAGVSIEIDKSNLLVRSVTEKGVSFKAVNDLRTHEYPGFPTDLQAPMTVFLTQAAGKSSVLETIYDGRFKYVEDLKQAGADIAVVNPREIVIKGPTALSELPSGQELRVHDIRAGFAIVLAALVGKGKFTVNNVRLLDRGYERLEEKLKAIGANIERK
ncbi:UDP-N-acetylglucosamine 1-carboxyvinyltransferase [Patescibacteria group bacterium]|nr:UDP-N-acetylglucosamine 1-carboxyvinyltransferase [Patescibacteria group bacterium]MDE1946474.1 UDP-N-acetylglucosamine 1-carboxyvinyltransferase [Patescibacteria group bacterium]MDE2011174.1 UDP-N-acetylglucosamine 1-carboxyvinyltransferase [Patescibacteria group bacterium]MDE2233570.1 UDP-N-acetylglucosamine 1-carboxyvinyltransferase [Patescibacteria group bacterium]